ncbi:hypothetical protein NC796_11525 [Aliifodinibius sp. S!AR15-10]|uniref:hypothetical protein n=1 Tax=Aliifodinibius sp. S!AR15-10 TaxID=2950437 RepID=UPI0028593AC2|nr:hypothetical protein [Aliifodinibius sp. S!AR15-10]MDR8391777.1 hypothetical protein [Aliifodinibius sp. S!AR15-10]
MDINKYSRLADNLKGPLLLFIAVAAGLWYLGQGMEPYVPVPEKVYLSGKERVNIEVVPEQSRIELFGLTPNALTYLDLNSGNVKQLFGVYAIPKEQWSEESMAMDGEWDITDRKIAFTSCHAWLPGVTYYVRVDEQKLNALMGKDGGDGIIDTIFTITPPQNIKPERVTSVYPSSDTLPQNLLKFYIHFSGSMSRGDVYDHIYILNEKGEVVPDAFLELPQELWDPGMTRLTILFDPGRIKRGLDRYNLMGVAFQPGKRYELVIDSTLADGNGLRMEQQYRKSFFIGEPDREMPDHKKWTIQTPPVETRKPLKLMLVEPLDHALLKRLITVKREEERIQGNVELSNAEQTWNFIPDKPWSPGRYTLEIEPILEDLAGNNLINVFDVELAADSNGVEKVVESESNVRKHFTIQVPG